VIDIPPEMVIEQRLVECGLNSKGLAVAYKDYLQSIEVVIRPEAGATEEHFPCIKKVAGYYIVSFSDTEMARHFSEFETELFRPQMLEQFRQSLSDLGLLDNFPERALFANSKLFAEALETHCGVPKGEVLKEFGESIMYQPPADHHIELNDKYICVMAAAMFAFAKGEMKEFGIVGNEEYSTEVKQK
jgi:hypothetical protein